MGKKLFFKKVKFTVTLLSATLVLFISAGIALNLYLKKNTDMTAQGLTNEMPAGKMSEGTDKALSPAPVSKGKGIPGTAEKGVSLQSQKTPVLIGVLGNRGYDTCLKEWGPAADYLSEKLSPLSFQIIPLDFNEIFEAVKGEKISHVSVNPSLYAYFEYHGLAHRIATMQFPGISGPLSVYGSVIFTAKEGNRINSLNDLRGKKFAAVDRNSLGGWHAAYRELMEAGINPERDFKSLIFMGTHDAVVNAVLSGGVDAGTVRSTQLEQMAKEGILDISDVKVLGSLGHHYPDYPYLLSTRLYPEWPLAALRNTDPELSKKMAVALLMMEESSEAAKSLHSAGWSIPQDYAKVHELLRILQLPPYDTFGKISFCQFARQYWLMIVSALLLFSSLTAFGLYTSLLNRRLKEMAESLRESERSKSLLLSHLPGMAYRCRFDRNWTMEFISDKCFELTGYTSVQLVDNRELCYNDIIIPEYRDFVWKKWEEAVEGHKTFCEEYKILTAGKNEKWVWEQGTAVYDEKGNAEALEGLIIDITLRKSAMLEKQSELEALEKRVVTLTRPLGDTANVTFEELFSIDDIQKLQDEFAEATGVASIITHPDGTPITRPSGFCRLCEKIIRGTEKGRINCYRSDAVIGRYSVSGPNIQHCLSGGLWDAGASITIGDRHIANWLIGQVRDETQSEESMRRYAREIGADEDIVAEAFLEVPPMPYKSFRKIAEFLYTVANQLSSTAYQNIQQARFITERKAAEEQKAAALEEREKLQVQLNQAQKMESVGRLAGGVAHDFNNMLGVILGHAEMALEKINPKEGFFSDLQQIRKAAERSSDLTRQLLAFARKQSITPKIIDLNETVEGMLKMLRRMIGEDINLAWLPGKNLMTVRMDISQLDQILANLCVNARDAISGIGKITIETENTSLNDEYCNSHPGFSPGEYVMLTVSDNGCGMEKEILDKLFEPFFTTKELGKGTGLGLATIYGIVKQNNGFINVYSEPAHGTSFMIYLPGYHAGKELSGENVKASESAERKNATILLVEDEPSILEMTSAMLSNLGYRILTAPTPGEAIELARKHQGEIQLLLTDVIMPEMNGLDLSRKIMEIDPEIKRLFMSGYTANVIADHGIVNEGVNFIQKPFSVKDLAGKVSETLAHST